MFNGAFISDVGRSRGKEVLILENGPRTRNVNNWKAEHQNVCWGGPLGQTEVPLYMLFCIKRKRRGKRDGAWKKKKKDEVFGVKLNGICSFREATVWEKERTKTKAKRQASCAYRLGTKYEEGEKREPRGQTPDGLG